MQTIQRQSACLLSAEGADAMGRLDTQLTKADRKLRHADRGQTDQMLVSAQARLAADKRVALSSKDSSSI